MALNENTTAGTGVKTQYMNQTLYSLWDAGKPQYVEKLFARFGRQFIPQYVKLRFLKKEAPIASNNLQNLNSTLKPHWFGFEENRFWGYLKVLSTVADPGPGNNSTFQLDPTLINNGKYFGKIGDIVTIAGTGIQAKITNITGTAPTIYITLTPQLTATTIGTLVAGDYIMISSGVKGSGTDQPQGSISGMTKREFYLQIFPEEFDIYGDDLTSEEYFNVYDNNGKQVPYSVGNWGTMQCQYRYDKRVDGAFLYGTYTDNPNTNETAVDGATVGSTTTWGLLPQIDALGQVMHIAPGNMTVDDFNDLAYILLQEGVSSDVAMLSLGPRRLMEIEALYKTYLQQATDFSGMARTISQSPDSDDVRSLSSLLKIREIYTGNVSFLLDRNDEWADPMAADLSGYDYTWQATCVPLTKFKDRVTGDITDNIAMRYVEKNGYNRRFEMWVTGGAGGDTRSYTDGQDVRKLHMRGHLGFQFFMMNQCTHILT